MQDHRNLRVWKHAHDLAVNVRCATGDFPISGYASLQSQMTRAAESIVFNIAEGCGASSQREFARFLGISIKSSFELEAQCELAKDYGALRAAVWKELVSALVSVRRMLFALRKKVLTSPHAKRMTLTPATGDP
ncbi:MAG: four helix bundle protein [Gemmatimonadaceae bacterium]